MRQVQARDLYGKMMRTLAQTGNGWMTFKDACNAKCNQTAEPGSVVHLSNLCTEITEVTSDDQTAVCNLGSVNLARHLATGPDGTPDVDWARLRDTVRTAVPFLDRVIDLTFYPSEQAAASNPRWRPVGLGVMGLQDVFFARRLPFDAPEARELSARIAEEVYLTALEVSAELAAANGPHPEYERTRAFAGHLQPDLWGAGVTQHERWAALRKRIAATGLRNSLLIAIAPTATIASIAGCYECIEPQVSNLFKRETMSGEFLQVNSALVTELKARGLWNAQVRDAIKRAEGSVQGLSELPSDVRLVFRTAWELPQRALIDLAVARAPFVFRSISVTQPVHGRADHRQALLDVHARLEERPQDDLLPALKARYLNRIQQATVHPRCLVASVAEGPWPCSREPRDLRGMPVTGHLLLDPGMDLTLRPMRYPAFYDRFRDAIRNAPGRWRRMDLHSRPGRPAPGCRSRSLAPGCPGSSRFFATGDATIVANNLVLNLYQHVNSPRGTAVPVAAAVRRRPSTCSSTSPCWTRTCRMPPSERRRSPPCRRLSRRSPARPEFCFKWIDSVHSLRSRCGLWPTGAHSCST